MSKNTKEGKKIKLICLGIVFFLILLNPVKNHIKRMNPKPRSIIRVQPNTNVKKQSPSKIIPKKDTPVNNKFLNNIQGNTSLSQNIVKENIPNMKLNYFITHILTDELKQKLNSSIRISYVGDLILLKQQVISAFNETTKKYDFNDMFKYTKEHFHGSDLSIGVFEFLYI